MSKFLDYYAYSSSLMHNALVDVIWVALGLILVIDITLLYLIFNVRSPLHSLLGRKDKGRLTDFE